MIKKIALLLLIAAALFRPIYAEPALYGPSGLITMPTAESLEYQQFNLALDYKTSGKTQEAFYKFNMGMFKNIEVGFVGGATPTEGVFINAKYFLISDNSRYPMSFAVGLQNLASKSDTGLYLVVSKKFQGGLNAHLGFNAVFATDELDPSLMGGVEYIVSDRLSLLGDFSGKRKKYTVNAGVRFAIYPDLSLRVSLLDMGNSSSESNFYSIGLAYNRFM
jgi:hypothetical protein